MRSPVVVFRPGKSSGPWSAISSAMSSTLPTVNVDGAKRSYSASFRRQGRDPPRRQHDQRDDRAPPSTGTTARASGERNRWKASRSTRSASTGPLWSVGWAASTACSVGFGLREAPVPSRRGQARPRRARPRGEDDHQSAARPRIRGDLHRAAPDAGADRRDRAAGGCRRGRAVAAVRRPPHPVPAGDGGAARPRPRRRARVRWRRDPRRRRPRAAASRGSPRSSGRARRCARSARGWRRPLDDRAEDEAG